MKTHLISPHKHNDAYYCGPPYAPDMAGVQTTRDVDEATCAACLHHYRRLNPAGDVVTLRPRLRPTPLVRGVCHGCRRPVHGGPCHGAVLTDYVWCQAGAALTRIPLHKRRRANLPAV